MKSLVFVCFALFSLGECGKIPEFIHICHRNDPELTKCIQNSVETLRPQLKKGIPELDVPPLEPLRIPEIIISRGESSSRFTAVLHDIDISGAGDFEITKLKLDIPNHIYRVGIKIPLLKLEGTYDVDARILVVPIKGKGQFHANATEVEGQAVIKAELKDVQGKTVMDFSQFNLKLHIGNYNVHLENLFEGDPVLSQAANDVLNENRNEFIVIATPFIEKKASEILLDIAKKIVKNFEYNEVFPAN